MGQSTEYYYKCSEGDNIYVCTFLDFYLIYLYKPHLPNKIRNKKITSIGINILTLLLHLKMVEYGLTNPPTKVSHLIPKFSINTFFM